MDELARARVLKRQIEANIAVLVPPTKSNWTPAPTDPAKTDEETSTILALRQDQNLQWSEITHQLNQKRLETSEPASLTPEKAYSRFLQHTTRMAQPVRELGFDARDYVHLRHLNQYVEGGAGEASTNVSASKAGKKRIKDYENAKELKANMRQVVGAEVHSELGSVDKTEKLVEAVAKVERNFWRLVAEEMERTTTKLYEPEELARRYHDI